jgi:exopolysaccharide biosynthesis polyprenyl glycosylphosphotransferase
VAVTPDGGTALEEAGLLSGGLAPVIPIAGGIDERLPSKTVLRRDAVYRRLLAVADVASAGIALLLAIQGLGMDHMEPALLLALPLVIAVAKLQGLYDRDGLLLNKTTLDEAPKLFQAATLYTLLVSLNDGWLIDGRLNPRQAIGLWLMLLVAAILGRTLVRMVAQRVTSTERVLVLGDAEDAQRLALKLSENTKVDAVVVGRIPLTEAQKDFRSDILGTMASLDQVVAEHRVHRVIVAPHGTGSAAMLEAIRAAKAIGVQVSVLPRLLEVVGSSVEFDQLYGVTLMGIRRFGLSRSSQGVKRALDLFGSAAGLVVLWPLMAALAVLVRRSSPGAALFRQERIGKDGTPFEVLKFRTMVDGADAMKAALAGRNEATDGLFKIAEDPRITPMGRFLRRTSLDELPQLINVLRGEMSLVGPRPLVPEEDSRIMGRHRRRLHLKPGMTGQWQIFGSSKIPLREMVTIDYLYVANWSLWGDVKILCRTLPYMLARRGL